VLARAHCRRVCSSSAVKEIVARLLMSDHRSIRLFLQLGTRSEGRRSCTLSERSCRNCDPRRQIRYPVSTNGKGEGQAVNQDGSINTLKPAGPGRHFPVRHRWMIAGRAARANSTAPVSPGGQWGQPGGSDHCRGRLLVTSAVAIMTHPRTRSSVLDDGPPANAP